MCERLRRADSTPFPSPCGHRSATMLRTAVATDMSPCGSSSCGDAYRDHDRRANRASSFTAGRVAAGRGEGAGKKR